MPRSVSSERVVAAVQVLAGLFGVSMVGISLVKSDLVPLVVQAFLGALIFPVSSIAAGFLLWQRRRIAVWLTLIVQCLQVPQLASTTFSYSVLCGAKFILLLWPRQGFSAGVENAFSISLGDPNADLSFGINLFPLALLLGLFQGQLGRSVLSTKFTRGRKLSD